MAGLWPPQALGAVQRVVATAAVSRNSRETLCHTLQHIQVLGRQQHSPGAAESRLLYVHLDYGSVVFWGSLLPGGDSSKVQEELRKPQRLWATVSAPKVVDRNRQLTSSWRPVPGQSKAALCPLLYQCPVLVEGLHPRSFT